MDEGTFFSTGKSVHAQRKVGLNRESGHSGNIPADLILQNSGPEKAPFLIHISGRPEKGAVRRPL